MKRTAMGLAAVLALAACGGSNQAPGSDTGAGSPAPAATPTPTAAPITIPLSAVGESGVTGTAEIVKGTGGFTVTMKLKGLAPGSNHVDHIHNGSCQANGGIAIALQPLAADGAGLASATSTINQDFAVPAGGWYVNVHAGPDLQGPNAKAIACGNVPPS